MILVILKKKVSWSNAYRKNLTCFASKWFELLVWFTIESFFSDEWNISFTEFCNSQSCLSFSVGRSEFPDEAPRYVIHEHHDFNLVQLNSITNYDCSCEVRSSIAVVKGFNIDCRSIQYVFGHINFFPSSRRHVIKESYFPSSRLLNYVIRIFNDVILICLPIHTCYSQHSD